MVTRVEDVDVGVVSGVAEIAITDEVVDEFLAAMEMDDPIFRLGAVQGGKRLAPSHLPPKLALYPLYGDFIEREFGGAVFAKQTFRFHNPVWVGSTVKATAKLIETYERRGKNFVVFEGQFSDEANKPLATERRTVIPLFPAFSMA